MSPECFQSPPLSVSDRRASPSQCGGLLARGLAAVIPRELGSPRPTAARQGPQVGAAGAVLW